MMICTKLVLFPTRERGLKPDIGNVINHFFLSFPTRERGLKLSSSSSVIISWLSFPTRERGLKQDNENSQQALIAVVPYAGTWIETKRNTKRSSTFSRRSLRGNVD